MRTRDLMQSARKLGKEAGENSASWCFDGNTKEETYRIVLRGIENGDPAVYDQFRQPDLSGEFADSPTPNSLAEELGIESDDERLDDVCTEWENASNETFWHEIEKTCRKML